MFKDKERDGEREETCEVGVRFVKLVSGVRLRKPRHANWNHKDSRALTEGQQDDDMSRCTHNEPQSKQFRVENPNRL